MDEKNGWDYISAQTELQHFVDGRGNRVPMVTGRNHSFDRAVEEAVAKRLRTVAVDIRRRGRQYGGNIEGAMLDIAAALEEAMPHPGLICSKCRINLSWENARTNPKGLVVCSCCTASTPSTNCSNCGAPWCGAMQGGKPVCIRCGPQALPPLNVAEAAAGPKKTSRCCNAEVSECDGRPFCVKCRLTRGV